MKIAMLQLNPTVGDVAGNAEKILNGYRKACAMGAELVVGTELALLGYPPKDLLLRREYLEAENTHLSAIAEHVGQTGLFLGATFRNPWKGKPIFNSALLLQNGARGRIVFKKLLPTYDVFLEKLYFEPGNPDSSNIVPYDPKLERGCQPVPDEYKELAVFICEDIWGGTEYGERLYEYDPLTNLRIMPPKVVIAMNASPYYLGKGDVRFDLVAKIATQLECPVIYVNQVGGNDELIFDGRSFAVDARGKCIGAAKAFQEDLLIIDLNNPTLQIYPSDTDNIDDLHDALVLGIRDYCRKTGFSQVVIGLSGGIDSAVTACLAVEALGNENVLGVALPSPFSSRDSFIDARDLTITLDIKFFHASINAAYEDLIAEIGGLTGGPIAPHMIGAAGVAAQNVQARVRGNILMGISNVTGRIVLATGNKSEIAMGYCTLYGDMAGGFAPLADVPKTLVYQLARHINRNGIVIPERTITKPPSAELAPDQKDSDSLPDYGILDSILHLYIEEQMGVEDIISKGFSKATVREVIAKVDLSEYKRHQMAPGLKITSKAFVSGRRMPIAAKFSA